jgi:hypothetical protein
MKTLAFLHLLQQDKDILSFMVKKFIEKVLVLSVKLKPQIVICQYCSEMVFQIWKASLKRDRKITIILINNVSLM